MTARAREEIPPPAPVSPPLSDEGYAKTRAELAVLGGIVLSMPLDEFIQRIETAEGLAPFVSARAADELARVKAVAVAARNLRDEIRRLQGRP